jgi:hypothetical protein
VSALATGGSLRDQRRHAVAHRKHHVTLCYQGSPADDGAMPRNDPGFRAGESDRFIERSEQSFERAAIAQIHIRIARATKVIPYGQDVVARKTDEGVAIGMRATDWDQAYVFSIHMNGDFRSVSGANWESTSNTPSGPVSILIVPGCRLPPSPSSV